MLKLLLIIAGFSMGLFSQSLRSNDVMSANELKEQIKSNKNLIILDVRTPEELKGPLGKISGVINIPIQNLEDRINELSKYKDKDVAVICRSGNRSKFGTDILKKNGFKAKNVAGGMIEFNK